MPTIADPSAIKFSYGDPASETGAIGGHFVAPALQDYSFVIDRGHGVDTSDGVVAGRDAFARISLYRDGQLVAETQPGQARANAWVEPSTYRDWAALGSIECHVRHLPEQANDAGPTQVLREHFGHQAAIDQSRER